MIATMMVSILLLMFTMSEEITTLLLDETLMEMDGLGC